MKRQQLENEAESRTEHLGRSDIFPAAIKIPLVSKLGNLLRTFA